MNNVPLSSAQDARVYVHTSKRTPIFLRLKSLIATEIVVGNDFMIFQLKQQQNV